MTGHQSTGGNAESWQVVLLFFFLVSCWSTSQSHNLDRETADSRLCDIKNGIISCPVIPLIGQNLTVDGTVYACTEPVYIRFRVKLAHSSHSSEYTFINEDETKEVREVNKTARFNVHLRYSENNVAIKARFLEEGYIIIFLETHVPIPSDAECAGADLSKGHVLPVAIVTIASVILAASAILLLVWWYRKRQKAKMTASELLADMESSPTSVPYQEEPITSEVTSSKPSSTTVIQNSVYRDSVVLDDSALETIAEEGEADDIITSPGGRSHKHKHRKTGARPTRRHERRTGQSTGRNGYRKTQNELVDVSEPDESSPTPCKDIPGSNGSTDRPSRPPAALEPPSIEQTTIARIAPPPKICISPAPGAHAKETKTLPT